ncbi:hypothetical protein EVAR_98883_1 [Eumeta japonica]|uniref:Uncharacterized protein n=1 Tax=Eumeta variegata TaxID=151549 RepID=A0A4C2AG17_EUMVA|nr:hypothetical protein EVAR_98883_1 [Eumeta japonica]
MGGPGAVLQGCSASFAVARTGAPITAASVPVRPRGAFVAAASAEGAGDRNADVAAALCWSAAGDALLVGPSIFWRGWRSFGGGTLRGRRRHVATRPPPCCTRVRRSRSSTFICTVNKEKQQRTHETYLALAAMITLE